MILGFSGQIGSGKTSVSKALAAYLSWPRVSFGDHVRLVATQRHLTLERKTLQDLGTELLDTDTKGFCQAVLAQAGEYNGHLIVDGVRHISVIEMLKELVKPSSFFHIHLVVPEFLKQVRNIKPTIEESTHPTEFESYALLSKVADIVIDNDENIGQVVNKILQYLPNIEDFQ